MAQESGPIMMARMQEQLRYLVDSTNEAKESRKGQYEKMEEHSGKLEEMNGRLKVVENALKDVEPTLAEFIVIKHQIKGAGIAGRWLWAIGGFLIASAAWLVSIKPWGN